MSSPAQAPVEQDAQSARLRRRLAREKAARQEAESLLESKSLELYDEQQKLVRLAASLEQRVQERTHELERARDEAVAALQDKTQFVSYVNHEIRNPLNGLFGLSEQLAQTPLEPQQSQLLEDIQHCAKHLYRVVNNVLDWVRSDQQEMASEQFCVSELLHDLHAMLRGTATAKGTRLTLNAGELGEQLWLGAPQGITQVLINLVSNALRHAEGGNVEVRCELEPASQDGSQSLCFMVEDDGPGLPPGYEQWLFKRFGSGEEQQVGSARSGLGLAISSALVARVGKRIEAGNRAQGGSWFRFSWPVTRLSPDSAEAPAAISADNLPRRRVLLVEDDPINQQVMRAYLKQLGQDVQCAGRVDEALRILAQQTFDIVLQDMRLPDGDGIDVARHLAADAQRRERVISISAEPPSEKQRPFYHGSIRKPILLQDLAAILADF